MVWVKARGCKLSKETSAQHWNPDHHSIYKYINKSPMLSGTCKELWTAVVRKRGPGNGLSEMPLSPPLGLGRQSRGKTEQKYKYGVNIGNHIRACHLRNGSI